MHQVPMAVHATFFISGSWIQHIPVRQHGTALIRDMEKVAIVFLLKI